MTAAALALAWAGLVATGLRGLRPPPRRVRELLVKAAGTSRWRDVRWRPPVSGRAAAAALVAVIVGLVALPLAPLGAAAVWARPAIRARQQRRRHTGAIAADLPEVVDLLALAVGAGLTNRLALEAIARHGRGRLVDELDQLLGQVRRGRRLADALDELPARAGEATRPLVSVLLASERYGVALGPALGRLADDVRRQRRRRAEEAARRVPVKLLFPLVLCVLPAFGLLTVAPLVAGALRSLRL
jgi:tight adherence protein C